MPENEQPAETASGSDESTDGRHAGPAVLEPAEEAPDPLAGVRSYLQHARILAAWEKNTGTSQRPIGVLLEGGVGGHVKLTSRGGASGEIEAEVAAWEIANLMGCGDLVAATVLREIDATELGEGIQLGSLQIDLPLWDTPPTSGELSESDIWRAALFDIVTGCTDRGEGQNWNAVGPPDVCHPVLFDHGLSFRGDGFGTLFAQLKNGQEIPDKYLYALRRVFAADLEALLAGLLRTEQIEGVRERAQLLLDTKRVAGP